MRSFKWSRHDDGDAYASRSKINELFSYSLFRKIGPMGLAGYEKNAAPATSAGMAWLEWHVPRLGRELSDRRAA